MRVPQIRLESQMARIQMKQIEGKQNITQQQAELTIEQPNASLTIETTPGRLTIDQTKAWEDMNLLSAIRSVEVAAQEGLNQLAAGMQRRAQQGAELMEIENDGNPLVSQAMINGFDQMKRLGINYIPSPFSVHIQYHPSTIDIEATANQPIINVKTNQVEHIYQPGSVDIQMERYQNLKIDFVNLYSETI